MERRTKLLLLIPHLDGGGAERVFAHLAQSLSPDRFEVHLCLVAQRVPGGTELPCTVRIHCIHHRRVHTSVFALLRLIRSVDPDVILSGMFHLNFLVLFLRPFFRRGTRVLVRQNGVASHAVIPGRAAFTRGLYRSLYPRADTIICQTQSMAAELQALLPVATALRVMPNPIDIQSIRRICAATAQPTADPHLLAVGRLVPEKGFDLLLHALRSVRSHCPGTRLTVLGAGPQEAELRALAAQLGLGAAVEFAGAVREPARWFPGATVFVLSSRQDALPNALLEAAAAGLPIVTTPASRGITTLLENRPGVWITTGISAPALAGTLVEALRSLTPGQRFPHPWIEDFDLPRAVAQYESLIAAAPEIPAP